MINSHFFPVPKSLQRDVVGIRVIQGSMKDKGAIKTSAMMTPGMVFQTGDQGRCMTSITTRSNTYPDIPILFLHGCRLEPSIMHFNKGDYTTFQVAFQPWALRTIFGLKANQVIAKPLNASLFGAAALTTQLTASTSTTDRIQLIITFLQDQLAQHGGRDATVEAGVTYIDENITTITVNSLIEHLGVTHRLLEKRFTTFIGCSPLKFIQIKRMNAALNLMWTGQYQKLSDIATALNYYDQAHLIRDLKRFSWLTPTAITQSITEFRQDESGIAYV